LLQRAGAFMIGWIMELAEDGGSALPAHEKGYLSLLLAKWHDAELQGV
jgi:hypothetical protein